MKKKIRISIILLLFNFFVFGNTSFYAHEIFEDGSPETAIKLSFDDRTSTGNVWLKVDYTGLKNSIYKDNISAIYNWNNIIVNSKKNKKIIVTNENVWHANVRYIENQESWEAYNFSKKAFAGTVLYDTRQNQIMNYNAAEKSTKIISKAYIYMNCNTGIFGDGYMSREIVYERIRKTISHELGHVLGLGHPERQWYYPISSSVYSVMRQGTPDYINTGEKVFLHDKIDLIFKYK